jgi:hypothetical protein
MYIASKKFEANKAVRGAFLMTDAQTRPLEFRCTNAIRPTPLQSMLYGGILDEYIQVELIGKPLVASTRDKPQLILVEDSKLLSLRPKVETPIAWLSKEERIGQDQNGDRYHLLNSPSGRFEAVVIGTHPDFPADKDQALSILKPIFGNHDVSEPFGRVSVALEQIHQQKVGEN